MNDIEKPEADSCPLQSSSPPTSSDSQIPSISSDFHSSQPSSGSITSVSEILDASIWANSPSTSTESKFAQNLSARLAKVSQGTTPGLSLSSRESQAVSRYFHSRQPTVRFQTQPTTNNQEIAGTSINLTINASGLPIEARSVSFMRKRLRPSATLEVHSPYPDDDSHVSKKPRLTRRSTVADPSRFAKSTATFRRALSLRSQIDILGQKFRTIQKSYESFSPAKPLNIPAPLNFEPLSDWIPTRPCTPVSEQSNSPSNPLRNAALYRDPLLIQSSAIPDVPIIAPPEDHTPTPPLSEASQAKLRLVRFREREEAMRKDDLAILKGLADALPYARGKEDRFDEIDELQDGIGHPELMLRGSAPLATQVLHLPSPRALGLGVIQWILEVSPFEPPDQSSSSASDNGWSERSCSQSSAVSDRITSFNSYSSSSSSPSAYHHSSPSSFIQGLENLSDQLLNSPETRFHAAYIFWRFFHLVFGSQDGKDMARPPTDFEKLSNSVLLELEGSEYVTWDLAVASLALSVKLHRDFLPPLLPVLAAHYENIAPHEMDYLDLEAAQRDILLGLSYSLGGTPQAILDDLWIALPSLRELLSFAGGWDLVLQETWLVLFEAVREPEIVVFSLSVVTAAAVIEGLVSALVRHFQTREPWAVRFRQSMLSRRNYAGSGGISQYLPPSNEVRPSRRRGGMTRESSARSSISSKYLPSSTGFDEFSRRKAEERVRRATIECGGVASDIQTVLGISDVCVFGHG
ncbi:hypothetical protein D9757_007331 [Collybiopsis confluens]|uniref:Uncharacterized protein n=1 Tax=Collybiopsis confluens TaxID=2823264 RepID=A0A8H5M6N9_9AGAR|nr:hypothetical protein D9757_007331 [Collybiopsis confluens]